MALPAISNRWWQYKRLFEQRARHLWRGGVFGKIARTGSRLRDLIAVLSLQHRIFFFVQVLAAVLVVFLWRHLPPPGWAVAFLALVAAVMSAQEKMRGWQKITWITVMCGLLLVELNSISKDRAESDRNALKARSAQDAAFQKIIRAQDETRAEQENDFKQTLLGLTGAIKGLQSVLRAANQTIEQTRPRSVMHFLTLRLENPPTSPPLFQIGDEYIFTTYIANDGNENATLTKLSTKIYVEKPDDRDPDGSSCKV